MESSRIVTSILKAVLERSSWNVRMPAPCPVPVITASSDTQNRLYKPARLRVRCLSGAKQGEIDPSMDHRNRFLRLIRQCFPTSTALQPFELSGRAQSFWAKLGTWDIPSQLVTLGGPGNSGVQTVQSLAQSALWMAWNDLEIFASDSSQMTRHMVWCLIGTAQWAVQRTATCL